MSSAETHRYQRFLAQTGDQYQDFPLASGAAGRKVLVTGAGGYIGSALVKALATAGPAQLVLLDSSEHNLFKIHRYLAAAHERLPNEAILGSVTDAGLLDSIFSRLRPEIVYHAAAFKHVLLLELNPLAAVRNNAIGTYRLAQAAIGHNASKLILVSTDKAVNPHSVMGASKRLAEQTVAALSGPQCRMNAVRLGNVIGSTGSVVQIFLKQISEGRPLTVTDPQASRYFMSLPEAVHAIVAGGAAECSGRILMPELGEPERIAGLARFLAATAANADGEEIPIHFTGLRPGEKLNEDLLYRTEVRDGFTNALGVITTPSPAPAEVHSIMEQLNACLAGADLAGLVRVISTAVPEYEPSRLVLAATGVEAAAAL
jgi:FlaA1/EpsC-like NDP-sugar epimerase